jgi:hypothetical protein
MLVSRIFFYYIDYEPILKIITSVNIQTLLLPTFTIKKYLKCKKNV